MSEEHRQQLEADEVALTLIARQNSEVSVSRRTSCSSSSAVSCASPNGGECDSGHFSGSNTSELSLRPISYSSEDDGPHVGQDIRAVRSELERLAKSELWYKNELKTQKRSKLELLEKLYVNERKFIRENQKLQTDCKRLYTLCDEIERRKCLEKDELVKRMRKMEKMISAAKGEVKAATVKSDTDGLHFEVQRQKGIVQDNENLIKTLRNQKQNLLAELRVLTTDRDAKILEIEKKTIALEFENRTITKRCLTLVMDKKELEGKVQATDELILQSERVRVDSQRKQQEINRLGIILNDLNRSKASEIQALKTTAANSGQKLDQLNRELVQLNAACAEKQRQNENLEAEIEEYKKMRQNFDKYVALLQGNSLELDSKCVEIDHLQSLVRVQAAQISDLNVSHQEASKRWQKTQESLQDRIESRDEELIAKQNSLTELATRKSGEIHKLRDRLTQLEQLNEKLLGQLRESGTERSKKTQEIDDLKNSIRELNELSVENRQLRKLLEIRDEELSQKTSHETFISGLQAEIQALKASLDSAKRNAVAVADLKTENAGLKATVQSINKRCEKLTASKSSLESELEAIKQSAETIHSENSQLHATVKTQFKQLNSLELENHDLKTQLAGTTPQTVLLASELKQCRLLIDRYESEKQSDARNRKMKNIQKLRETSPKVPETCDSGCQTELSAVSSSSPSLDEIKDLRLLHRVMESEHRKQIARYEVHIRTLLGKIRSYRNRDTAEKTQELKEYEQKIVALRQQLSIAMRRAADGDRFKHLNLQLQTNLTALTDDYKRLLLAPVSLKSTTIRYDDLYQLIDESNRFVPNCDRLTDSIGELKDDLSRLKTIIATNPVSQTPILQSSNYHNPVKRLSLMDELKAAGDSFIF